MQHIYNIHAKPIHSVKIPSRRREAAAGWDLPIRIDFALMLYICCISERNTFIAHFTFHIYSVFPSVRIVFAKPANPIGWTLQLKQDLRVPVHHSLKERLNDDAGVRLTQMVCTPVPLDSICLLATVWVALLEALLQTVSGLTNLSRKADIAHAFRLLLECAAAMISNPFASSS